MNETISTRIHARSRSRRSAEDREKKILSFIGLAGIEARKCPIFGGYVWIDRDDLEAIGIQAVVDAVDTFDPSLGVKLKTHVICRIRIAMLRALQRHRNADYDKAPGYAWVGFDNACNSNGDDISLADILRDLRSDFEDVIVLKTLIDSLPSPHRDIMRMSAFEGLMNVEIAARLGCDKSRITARLSEAREFLTTAIYGTDAEITRGRKNLETRFERPRKNQEKMA